MLMGYSFETLYLFLLIGCLGLSVLLFLFSGIFEAFDGPLDPVVIVPWLAFIALLGYIGETQLHLSSIAVFATSVLLATIIVFFLNYYVILPMRQADATISSSEKEIEGRMATVITPIPVGGMGEIAIDSVTGRINRPASHFDGKGKEIPAGTKVLVIEIKERVAYVNVYKEMF